MTENNMTFHREPILALAGFLREVHASLSCKGSKLLVVSALGISYERDAHSIANDCADGRTITEHSQTLRALPFCRPQLTAA